MSAVEKLASIQWKWMGPEAVGCQTDPLELELVELLELVDVLELVELLELVDVLELVELLELVDPLEVLELVDPLEVLELVDPLELLVDAPELLVEPLELPLELLVDAPELLVDPLELLGEPLELPAPPPCPPWPVVVPGAVPPEEQAIQEAEARAKVRRRKGVAMARRYQSRGWARYPGSRSTDQGAVRSAIWTSHSNPSAPR
jgi:zinc finger protein PLAGL1